VHVLLVFAPTGMLKNNGIFRILCEFPFQRYRVCLILGDLTPNGVSFAYEQQPNT